MENRDLQNLKGLMAGWKSLAESLDYNGEIEAAKAVRGCSTDLHACLLNNLWNEVVDEATIEAIME